MALHQHADTALDMRRHRFARRIPHSGHFVGLMKDRDVRAQEPDLEVSQSNLCILENRLHARSLTAGDQRREEPLRWDQLSVRNGSKTDISRKSLIGSKTGIAPLRCS